MHRRSENQTYLFYSIIGMFLGLIIGCIIPILGYIISIAFGVMFILNAMALLMD